jgi:S-adenosylmethionine-diacylgycerolhomoserine-N-methlytransferase
MNAFLDFATDPSEENRQSMDRMYRWQRHVYDATRKYYLLGRDQLIADLNCPPGGSILEMGCGTARNLAFAGRTYPDSRLFGCDISDQMLQSAGKAISAAGLASRTRLAQADATTFNPKISFCQGGFDRIYFSYTLSMIPAWTRALACAASFLLPGGELHVVDFGTCSGQPVLFRNGLHRWLKLFDVTPRENLVTVGAVIAAEMGLTACSWHSHGGYAAHLRMFRPDGKIVTQLSQKST